MVKIEYIVRQEIKRLSEYKNELEAKLLENPNDEEAKLNLVMTRDWLELKEEEVNEEL